MTDILIRGLDDASVQRIDAEAKRRGLSRNEYLRREWHVFAAPRRQATREDWERFAELAQDLADEEVMRQAWS